MTKASEPDRERIPLLPHLNLLVQCLSASWPRRSRALLEVGCGDGRMLEVLWTLGFDITGLDRDEEELRAARERLGDRCDLRIGSYDALPFEDDAFDYIVLAGVFFRSPDLDALIREAVRVATRHVLLIFPNAWSLAALMGYLPWKASTTIAVYNPLAMLNRLRQACPGGQVRLRSILPGPPGSWGSSSLWRYGNDRLLLLPLGAFVGMRLDLMPQSPVTGLPLRVKASRLTIPGTSTVTSRGAVPD